MVLTSSLRVIGPLARSSATTWPAAPDAGSREGRRARLGNDRETVIVLRHFPVEPLSVKYGAENATLWREYGSALDE
jgi:hypothetical protein